MERQHLPTISAVVIRSGHDQSRKTETRYSAVDASRLGQVESRMLEMKRDDKDAFLGSVAKKDLDLYDPNFRVQWFGTFPVDLSALCLNLQHNERRLNLMLWVVKAE